MTNPATVLVVGATGSIGHLVLEEALRQGYTTRALVRDAGKARQSTGSAAPNGWCAPADCRTRSFGPAGSTTTAPTNTSSSQTGTPSDGVIARSQIAEVLIRSLGSDTALNRTFELVATTGPETDDFDALFAALEADAPGGLDGVRDTANMPLADEPQQVQDDLEAFRN